MKFLVGKVLPIIVLPTIPKTEMFGVFDVHVITIIQTLFLLRLCSKNI